MSALDAWLAERRPPPPAELARALGVEEQGTPLEALTEAGLARLAEARARPGRVRESAFRLLEADALLTYACEAALETTDPRRALGSIFTALSAAGS